MESTAKEQYENKFIRIQKQLTSFVYRLVTNKEDTKDLVQETYIKAMKNLSAFEGRSSYKTWVFAIATNLCKDFLKSQSRWTEDYQDNCRTTTYGILANTKRDGRHCSEFTTW